MRAVASTAVRSLVTVVGSDRRVDLALPSHTPMVEYTDVVADLCGQENDEALPPVWGLATAGGPVLPLTRSLAELEVRDGAVLYLRDIAAGEDDEPVVRSVAEIVSDLGVQDSAIRWDRRARSRTVILGSVLWLLAAMVFLAPRPGRSASVALVAAALGALLILVAWALRTQPRALPELLRLLVGWSVVPSWAVAAAMVPGDLHADLAHAGSAEAGAALGLMLALTVVPDVVAAVAVTVLVIAAVVSTVALALGASSAAAAGTVVVLGVLFLGTAPRTAGLAITLAGLRMSSPTIQPRAEADHVSTQVQRAHRTLTILVAVTCAALAAAELVLSDGTSGFATGLSAVAAAVLVLRCGGFEFLGTAIWPAAAAGIGLFGVLAGLTRYPATDPFTLPAMVLLGILAITVALSLLLWSADSPPRPAGGSQHSWVASLLLLGQFALVPLLIGVFDVYDVLWHIADHT